MTSSSQLKLNLSNYEITHYIDGIFTELMTVTYPPQTPFYAIQKDWQMDMSPLIQLDYVGCDTSKNVIVIVKRLKTEDEVSAYIQSNRGKSCKTKS